ncbi:MAG: hypothetical protein JSS07_07395 [Proteobacteria bacterium]|nr:hypothetical protein [Pseudomonadota bacterium]
MPKDTQYEEQYRAQPSYGVVILRAIFGGSVAGMFEVMFNHPLWTLKTRYQNEIIPKSQKFTLDPTILYRGTIPEMLSMAPITAIQVTIVETLKAAFHRNSNPPSYFQEVVYNGIGGAISAIVGSPTELGMSHQTKEQGFFETLQKIYEKEGSKGLRKGLVGTAGRDTIYTAGYGVFCPYLQTLFSYYMSKNKAKIVGGVTAGLGVAVLTQPLDTMKTMQQTGVSLPMYTLAKKILKDEGIEGFYKGSIPRAARVTSGVIIINEVNQLAQDMLKLKL